MKNEFCHYYHYQIVMIVFEYNIGQKNRHIED